MQDKASRHPAPELLRLLERRARNRATLLCVLGVALIMAFLLAVGQGAVAISPSQVIAIIGAQIGVGLPWPFEELQEMVLLSIRLPRAVLGMAVGAALAVSGAALQGLFRNPLADPGLIGVSTGAALAASAMIVFGNLISFLVPPIILAYALPLAAFIGGLSTAMFVYRLSSHEGRAEVATLLLAGIAINAIAGTGIGLLIFLSTDQQIRDLNFWMLGSLGGVTWDRLAIVLPFILVPTALIPLFARNLNALVMGEREALHLGFEVERTKRRIIVLAALAVGASVALTGVIGFVGLVVPHIIRLIAGADHRTLLPATIMLGATLLLISDLLARHIVLPAELPIGILTSCIGGPFFLWLLVRRRGRNFY
ncbi:MAG: iron ABC transporter [Woeseia sp.]|nr:iron ABC transporter [Woeseia sp.]